MSELGKRLFHTCFLLDPHLLLIPVSDSGFCLIALYSPLQYAVAVLTANLSLLKQLN